MHRSVSGASLIVVNANWIGLSFMWNALHPIVLPALLLGFVPASRKNTYLGLLTFAGLLIAMALQPISGALSDRWSSPLGRRRPLMIIGTILDCVFLIILGWSRSLGGLFLGYVGLQISANTAQGPLQGLLRDRVPQHQLGAASSVKVFLDMASLVLASLAAGRIMGAGGGSAFPIMLVILVLLLTSAGITILFTREEASGGRGEDRSMTAISLETTDVGGRAGYWWLIGERAAFLLGVYGLQAFGQYYLQDVLRVADPPRQAGYLLAAIGAGTMVLVLAGGWLADRYGPKRLLFVASGLASFGMVLMWFTRDLRGLSVIGSIVGAGIGLFLTSNWALANRIAPLTQAGRYLGLTNLATAGAAALARLEGPAIDALNAARPEAWLGYKSIFVLGALFVLLSCWFLTKVK